MVSERSLRVVHPPLFRGRSFAARPSGSRRAEIAEQGNDALQLLVHALRRETVGEPDAGNPHVRFDEEEQGYVRMVNLNGHEAGNGGHCQGEPKRHASAPYSTGSVVNPPCRAPPALAGHGYCLRVAARDRPSRAAKGPPCF